MGKCTCEAVGKEDVEPPAARYERSMRLECDCVEPGGIVPKKFAQTQWLAPGVGMVRLIVKETLGTTLDFTRLNCS